MVADPRMSDGELAAINAAAVTREYRVQPHLGAFKSISITRRRAVIDEPSRLPHCFCDQWVSAVVIANE
jgi:V-type H+-transporting ATPase subunit B